MATLNTLHAMIEGLRDLEAVQLDMYRTTLSAADTILTGVERASVGACLERAEAVKVEMTKEEFAACVSAIRAIGTQGFLERRQQPLPMTEKGLLATNAINARRTPELFVRVVGEEFRRRSREIRSASAVPNPPAPAVSTAGPLVSPYHWIGLANMYRAFLEAWDDYGDLVRPDGEFRRVMRSYRQGLRELIESIAADIVNYEPAGAEGAASTVLAGMVRDIRRRQGEVVDAFEREMDIMREAWRERDEPLDYFRGADQWQRVGGDWDHSEVRSRFTVGADEAHCDQTAWDDIGVGSDRYDSDLVAYRPAPGALDDRLKTFAELSLPYVRRPTHKDRVADLALLVEERLKRSIPGPVRSLAALGVGRVYVCVVGFITEERVYDIAPEKPRTRAWAVTEAIVHTSVRWKSPCSWGGTATWTTTRQSYRSEMALALRATGFLGGGKIYVSNIGDSTSGDPTGRVPALGTSVTQRNRWYAMNEALELALGDAGKQLDRYSHEQFDHCLDVYRRNYQDRHVKALVDVVQRAGVRNAIEDYNEAVSLANMYIRSWFRIALNGAARDFDPVSDIVLGFGSLPRWDQGAGEDYMDVAERVAARIDAYELALANPELRQIARHYAGFPGLTDTEYPGID